MLEKDDSTSYFARAVSYECNMFMKQATEHVRPRVELKYANLLSHLSIYKRKIFIEAVSADFQEKSPSGVLTLKLFTVVIIAVVF